MLMHVLVCVCVCACVRVCVCLCWCLRCVCVCVLRLGRLGMHGQLGGLLLQLPAPLHTAPVSQQPDVRSSGVYRHSQPLPPWGVRLHLHHVLLYREYSHGASGETPWTNRGLVEKPVDKLNAAWFGVYLDRGALGNVSMFFWSPVIWVMNNVVVFCDVEGRTEGQLCLTLMPGYLAILV